MIVILVVSRVPIFPKNTWISHLIRSHTALLPTRILHHSMLLRIDSSYQRHASWRAIRCWTCRVGKEKPFTCETINVWRIDNAPIATQNIALQLIRKNQQDVWLDGCDSNTSRHQEDHHPLKIFIFFHYKIIHFAGTLMEPRQSQTRSQKWNHSTPNAHRRNMRLLFLPHPAD